LIIYIIDFRLLLGRKRWRRRKSSWLVTKSTSRSWQSQRKRQSPPNR